MYVPDQLIYYFFDDPHLQIIKSNSPKASVENSSAQWAIFLQFFCIPPLEVNLLPGKVEKNLLGVNLLQTISYLLLIIIIVDIAVVSHF